MKKHTVTHKINKTFFPSLRDLVRILSNNCNELRSTFRLYNKWACVPAALKHTYSGRTCLADGMYTGSGTHSALYRIQDTRIFCTREKTRSGVIVLGCTIAVSFPTVSDHPSFRLRNRKNQQRNK